MCPLGALCCVCRVPGHLTPVHRSARSVCCVACAVFPWPLGSCSPVCTLGVLCVRCPWTLGSSSPVCPLGVLCCVCGVVGHLGPVHRSICSVCCVACAVSLATWLLFTGVPAWCVVLRVRCPWPLGFCSRLWPLSMLCCVCGVCGHLASVHRCARWLYCVCRGLPTPLQFTAVPARCVLLRVRCPWPHGPCSTVRTLTVLCLPCTWPVGSCSPVCPLGVLCCMCSVPRHLAPVHRCARSVFCVACVVSLAL